jgi:glutamyl-tRNA reductase
MTMQILVVGLDHHTSPVEVREQIAFSPSRIGPALAALTRTSDPLRSAPLREAVILSTCNRVEIYGCATDTEAAQSLVAGFLHDFHGLGPGMLDASLYSLHGQEAVTHLLATACGLNSLAFGEVQIQAQVRAASEAAAAAGVLGPILHALFRQAVEAGKRARTETAISRNATSISHAGVELARRRLGDLRGAHIVLLGSGKMSELAAKNLIDNGAGAVTVVNRTLDRAQALAMAWGGRALSFDALGDALRDADVVLASTSSPQPVIEPDMVRSALDQRRSRPLLLIDMAVPRDVDPAVAAIPGAHVYDIDDLADVVAANLERRREEILPVQRIIDEEVVKFMAWFAARAVVPTMNQLRAQAEQIRRGEFDKAMKRLPSLSERDRAVVESMAMSIVNKLLHQPTVRLKQEAASGDPQPYTDALRVLFDLDAGA